MELRDLHQTSSQEPTHDYQTPMTEIVRADPTKDFFISMITRDISLEDCILDLLDNCIDGARSTLHRGNGSGSRSGERFAGFSARITAKKDSFSISDNCGGIAIKQAKNYAFHFGRHRDAPAGAPDSVGLYGIGMKRALFKIGRQIAVRSSTGTESFVVPIDVEKWASVEKWDFEMKASPPFPEPGTSLEIHELNDGVGEEFGDEVFVSRLISTIGRDYSLILRAGFAVFVNDFPVVPFEFGWLVSEDFAPARQVFESSGVQVEITAGSCQVPPDEDSPDETDSVDTQYFGWFVVCNDRVVLAGNKDDRTVWGDENFPKWHPQYNGFNGIVHFRAADPKLLPWTTTKRGVDETAPVYRQAISRMKLITRTYIDYTNARKQNLEEAKQKETLGRFVSTIPATSPTDAMKVPAFPPSASTRVKSVNIAYAVPEKQFIEVATALGDRRMPKKHVGLQTFDFYRDRIVESGQ